MSTTKRIEYRIEVKLRGERKWVYRPGFGTTASSYDEAHQKMFRIVNLGGTRVLARIAKREVVIEASDWEPMPGTERSAKDL